MKKYLTSGAKISNTDFTPVFNKKKDVDNAVLTV
jgi:hypothetical protein